LHLLQYLIIARISNPASKLKTTEYLKSYCDINISDDKICQYLDKLYKEQKQQISYKYTLKVLKGKIRVVFVCVK
jgi:hypothetical protein